MDFLILLAILAGIVAVLLTARCFVLNMRAAETGRLAELHGYHVARAAEQRRNAPPSFRSSGGYSPRPVNLTKPVPPSGSDRSSAGVRSSRSRIDDDSYAGASAGIGASIFDSGAGYVFSDSGGGGGYCDSGGGGFDGGGGGGCD